MMLIKWKFLLNVLSIQPPPKTLSQLHLLYKKHKEITGEIPVSLSKISTLALLLLIKIFAFKSFPVDLTLIFI